MAWREFIIKITLLFFGIFTSLAIAEIGLRLIPESKMAFDRPVLFYLPEHSSNLRGLPKNLPPKAEGTIRIFVVGDSFTFSPHLQLYDTLPSRLEWLFNLNSQQPKVEIINYGFSGSNTARQTGLVKDAITNGADLIVHQINLNDTEKAPLDRKIFLKNFSVPDHSEHWYGSFKLITLISNQIYKWLIAKRTLNYYRALYQENSETYQNFKNALAEIRDICGKHSTPLLAVIFPLISNKLDENYPFLEYHKKIQAELEFLKVNYIDLLETFKNIPSDRLTVLPGKDAHPNEIANGLAADAIYRKLHNLAFLPKEIFAKTVYSERVGERAPRIKNLENAYKK
ncbi:MAG TPA: SGNH/GDSL hydrolase family protein [Oligoflexia bacterium]|nr:SGNH/GDSL hydrolase family protein [Oligoflexia bacterium]HMP27159.1 SGNH/GDSL hydrolase family protein [Oligoflexia bacterium]